MKTDNTTRGKAPLVRYRDETPPATCPYGHVQRVVTGGEGGVANVHVVTVTAGTTHFHAEYDEIYYVLSGHGTLTLNGDEHPLRPGAVAVIPAGVPHSLEAAPEQELVFAIVGTPPVPITDPRAAPRSA